MKPASFMENGKPLEFDAARFSGISAGVPGTPATWARALKQVRHLLAQPRRCSRGSASPRTASPSTRPSSTRSRPSRPTSTTSRRRPRSISTPSAAEATRHPLTDPDMAKTYSGWDAGGARVLPRRVADAMARRATQPPVAPDADHTWRAGPDDHARPPRLFAPERPATGASYRGLDVYGMGPPSSGGTTVGEALNILGGYNPSASRSRALHRLHRGFALHVRRPQRYLADPAFFDVPSRAAVDSFADERRALITDMAARTTGRARRSPRQPGRPRERRRTALRSGPAPVDDASHDRRRQGHRRVVHVHDRVDRRQRHRRAGLRVPAQQRADGLQLRLDDAPEPRRRRQAPAQLDGADDHRDAGKPYLAARLAGRLDDPRHGAADAGQPDRPAEPLHAIACRAPWSATPRRRRPSRRSSTPPRARAAVASGHQFAPPATPGEIGAATAIEFRGRGFFAAAEPRAAAAAPLGSSPSRLATRRH